MELTIQQALQQGVAAHKKGQVEEADMPPRDALASPLTLEAKKTKKPDANKNGIPDYAEDGKGKNDLTKKKRAHMHGTICASDNI